MRVCQAFQGSSDARARGAEVERMFGKVAEAKEIFAERQRRQAEEEDERRREAEARQQQEQDTAGAF